MGVIRASKPSRYIPIISSTIHFGPNVNCRHKKIKESFACQNHLIKPPPKAIFPNRRVQPLLKSMEFISPLISMLGVDFSINEMTMRFKVHHVDKKNDARSNR